MDIFEKLKQYAKMETDEDIRKFEIGVWNLAETKNPEILERLIDLFDDNCPYYEVMYSLLHAIEDYPNNIYVITVLKKLPDLLNVSPEWTDRIVNRIFNDSECQDIFIKNMRLAPKNSLLKLFDLMEKESPHHCELIQSLRKKLEK